MFSTRNSIAIVQLKVILNQSHILERSSLHANTTNITRFGETLSRWWMEHIHRESLSPYTKVQKFSTNDVLEVLVCLDRVNHLEEDLVVSFQQRLSIDRTDTHRYSKWMNSEMTYLHFYSYLTLFWSQRALVNRVRGTTRGLSKERTLYEKLKPVNPSEMSLSSGLLPQ